MNYYSYTKITTPGPNGTTLKVVTPDDQRENELGTIDGLTYISLPDDVVLPEQPAEINLQSVTMTDALKEQLKLINPWCKLVAQQIRAKIRERYDSEDEMYLTRISVGVLAGMYTYLPGEAEAVVEYGQYIEGTRQWGRDERAKVGL